MGFPIIRHRRPGKVSLFLRVCKNRHQNISPRLHCFATHIMRSDVGFHLMKSPAHIVCSVIIVLALSETGLRCARIERSVSPSQQFIIYGANGALRGILSELAEQTKTNLLALLQQPDRWKTPIVVNLQPQQANLPEIPPTELRFSQTGSGLKLQLDLKIAQNLDASLMERELLRAILLEMIYRKEPDIAPGSVF